MGLVFVLDANTLIDMKGIAVADQWMSSAHLRNT